MNWSQQELADEFRVSVASVGRWETGERRMLGPATRLLELYEKDLNFCIQDKKKLNRMC